jgi:hypothetical protein
MRFAWIPPQYDAKNQVALFNPAAYDPAQAVTIDCTTGNIINADGGNPLNGMQYTNQNQLRKADGIAAALCPSHGSALHTIFSASRKRSCAAALG